MRVLDGGTTWSLVLLLACGSALAGYMAFQKPRPKPPATSGITVGPEVFDFGEIGQGKKVSAKYQITNQDDSVIEILTVRTECGCTTTDIGQKFVPPGGSTTVEVNWISGTNRGPTELISTLVCRTATGMRSAKKLGLRGIVLPDIAVTPFPLTFQAGVPGSQRLLVTAGQAGKFKVLEVYASHSSFEIRAVPGETDTFDVEYRPDGGGLPSRLTVTIQTDLKSNASVDVPILVTPSSNRPPTLMPGANR